MHSRYFVPFPCRPLDVEHKSRLIRLPQAKADKHRGGNKKGVGKKHPEDIACSLPVRSGFPRSSSLGDAFIDTSSRVRRCSTFFSVARRRTIAFTCSRSTVFKSMERSQLPATGWRRSAERLLIESPEEDRGSRIDWPRWLPLHRGAILRRGFWPRYAHLAHNARLPLLRVDNETISAIHE